jgi:hypothetical protein
MEGGTQVISEPIKINRIEELPWWRQKEEKLVTRLGVTQAFCFRDEDWWHQVNPIVINLRAEATPHVEREH